MATAEQLRHGFEGALRQSNIPYEVIDEKDNLLALYFRSQTLDRMIQVLIDFVENNDDAYVVRIVAYQFALVEQKDFTNALLKINKFNEGFRFAKFYLTFDEQDQRIAYLHAAIDSIVFPESANNECFNLFITLADILDMAYTELRSFARFFFVEPVDPQEQEQEQEEEELSEEEIRAMIEMLKRKLDES